MTLTLVSFLLFVLKAFVVVMFAMNVAVILTWADRRQGAMIQDRVGPNRAVAWIPTKVAQALAVGPALAVIAGVAFVVLKLEPPPEELGSRAMLFSQLGILFTWMTGVVLASGTAGASRTAFTVKVSPGSLGWEADDCSPYMVAADPEGTGGHS